MMGVAISAIIESGLKVRGYVSEIYLDDGIEMLGYTFKTAQATPEFLADLQLEINRRLVDYEVEHSLPVPNVVFSVESAQ